MDSLKNQSSTRERRREARLAVNSLTVLDAEKRARTTRLVNISAGGAMVGPLFGVEVGDKATLNVPGYGKVTGRVVRLTDDNFAAICFSPDPDFRALCEERAQDLQEMIHSGQMAFQNPYASELEKTAQA